MAAASVAGEVLAPFTTSNVFMTLAGTKKCVPATSSGRFVTLAISSMSSAEVLEKSSAPGFMTASSLANTSFFTGICSNTASITASQSAIAS